MTGLKFLLDTNMVIGLLNGDNRAIKLMTDCTLSECAIAQITRIELLSFPDLPYDEECLIQRFMAAVTVLVLDEGVEKLIPFRRNQGVKLYDAMIAATALYHRLHLLTLDESLATQVNRAEDE